MTAQESFPKSLPALSNLHLHTEQPWTNPSAQLLSDSSSHLAHSSPLSPSGVADHQRLSPSLKTFKTNLDMFLWDLPWITHRRDLPWMTLPTALSSLHLGLDSMISRGPFQPLPLCNFMIGIWRGFPKGKETTTTLPTACNL